MDRTLDRTKIGGARFQAADEQLANAVVMAAIGLVRTLRALTRSGRLSGPEISALAIVAHAGRIKARDLAAFEEVSPAAISKLVAAMAAKGLIARAADKADGRAQWIRTTAKGARLVTEGHSRRVAPLAASIAVLPVDDRRRLAEAVAIIDRLVRAVRADVNPTAPPRRPRSPRAVD